MESLGSVDLFSTKGIEYLFVMGYFLTLVIFWKTLNKPALSLHEEGLTRGSRNVTTDWFHVVEGFFFHQGHSWVMPEESGVVKVGIDDFAQKLLGIPTSIEMPQIGSRIEQGSKGWKLKIDSKYIDILSPVNGEVLAINEEVLRFPELICDDPYGKGWIMKVKATKLKTDLKNLISGRLAIAWMEETINNLRKKIAGDLGIVFQDGGLPIIGFVRNLSPDKWDEIANEFLLTNEVHLQNFYDGKINLDQ